MFVPLKKMRPRGLGEAREAALIRPWGLGGGPSSLNPQANVEYGVNDKKNRDEFYSNAC
jgi:hypothetical protein